MEKVSVKMLSGIRAAEKSLAQKEIRDMEDSLPEGHPLRDEMDKKRSELGGDLSDLPSGHPLLRTIKQAKERYDKDIAEETEDSQENAKQVRKAKKVNRQDARKKKIIHEEEQADKYRTAATSVNDSIDKTLGSVKELYESLSSSEEFLDIKPISRAKSMRLKRLLVALERGLSDSKMGRV